MGYAITSRHLNDVLSDPMFIENVIESSKDHKKEMIFFVRHSFKTSEYAVSESVPGKEGSTEGAWTPLIRPVQKPNYDLIMVHSHDSGKISLSYDDLKGLHELRRTVKSHEGIVYNPLIGIIGRKKSDIQVLLVQEKTPITIDDKLMRFLSHLKRNDTDANSIADFLGSSHCYNAFAYEIFSGVNCKYLSNNTSRFEFTPVKI